MTEEKVLAIIALRDYCNRSLEGDTKDGEDVLSALVNLVDTVRENAHKEQPIPGLVAYPPVHGPQAKREVDYVDFMLVHDSEL